MKHFLLWCIGVYRRRISPRLPRRCKYYPTCSEYAYDAIRLHGVVGGLALALWRILRCNPFSLGGFDPVPETFTFAHVSAPAEETEEEAFDR